MKIVHNYLMSNSVLSNRQTFPNVCEHFKNTNQRTYD